MNIAIYILSIHLKVINEEYTEWAIMYYIGVFVLMRPFPTVSCAPIGLIGLVFKRTLAYPNHFGSEK